MKGHIEQALALMHRGQWDSADAVCHQVLQREPRHFDALQLQGHIALQRGDYAVAARRLTAACSINPGNAVAWSNLAVALLAMRRPLDALDACDRAVSLKPSHPEAHFNRGNALLSLDRPTDALGSYGRTLALHPGFSDAHVGRTKAWLSMGKPLEALASGLEALKVNGGSADAWCQVGAALMRLKRAEEALFAFDRAVELAPGSAEVANNRGTALRDLKRPLEALEAYAAALRLRPDFAEAYCNVANIGLDSGRYQEALGYCDKALGLQPHLLEALNIRGTTLRVLKRYGEAAAAYQAILAVSPRFGHAMSHLVLCKAHLCDWAGRSEQAADVVQRIHSGENAASPHTFLWLSGSAEEQMRCARAYSDDQYPVSAPQWHGRRYQHSRLRVGYLSADFSDHPVAHLICGVLERHDRSRFETVGLALHRSPTEDAMQMRIRRAFEHYHDVSEVSDVDAAKTIAELEIDILVDLTGHTRGGRLGILAARAAPVQVNFLGFTGTSGAPYVDYLIGDRVATPGETARFFTEQLVRMPNSFLPNDDRQHIAEESPSRRELDLPDAGFVFCAFNNSYKLNPVLFDVWMELLKSIPDSVLWLRAADAEIRANLSREAVLRGVQPQRLVFAGRMPDMHAHLARYRQADLFLDTFPYGAHATARDALWAGLPVVTCTADAFASRVAASLLRALSLPELVTSNLDEYAALAAALADSPDRLAGIRAKLAHARGAGGPFDTDLYRRDLECAYLAMSARRGRDEPAECIDVASIR